MAPKAKKQALALKRARFWSMEACRDSLSPPRSDPYLEDSKPLTKRFRLSQWDVLKSIAQDAEITDAMTRLQIGTAVRIEPCCVCGKSCRGKQRKYCEACLQVKGKTVAPIYCGRHCQKTDWIAKHRLSCSSKVLRE